MFDDENYLGWWPSFRAFADHFLDTTLFKGVPECLTKFYDREAFAEAWQAGYRVEPILTGGMEIYRLPAGVDTRG